MKKPDEKELKFRMEQIKKGSFKTRVDDLNALREEFGDRVVEIIQSKNAEKTKKQWEAIAKRHGSNDIQALKDTLWKWVEEDGFEFTCEDTPEGTQFTVTKCPLVDLAKEFDACEWGYILNCASAPSIVEGFNKNMGFKRTKTLMEGHDCCNHFYYMKEE